MKFKNYRLKTNPSETCVTEFFQPKLRLIFHIPYFIHFILFSTIIERNLKGWPTNWAGERVRWDITGRGIWFGKLWKLQRNRPLKKVR